MTRAAKAHPNGGRARTAKTLQRRLMCSASLAAVLSSLPLGAFAAGALPTGGAVASGAAVISSPGAGALTVQQTSGRAIVNWSSFSIGQGASVTFDNGSGATLNRVSAGGPLSALDGTLSATGSVYLINPSGVIVGKTGVINVGGTFVASTQNITDSGFLAGGSLTFNGGSNGAVVNYGRIGALGGDVVLIASKVQNQGVIDASKGAVGLLAGYQVLLKDQADADGHFEVKIGGSGTSATNAGAISAAAVELRAEQGSIYALAGNTAGVIRATEVSGSGGDIQLLAPGGTARVASGAVLDASAGAAGNGGHIQVDSADTTFAGTALARGGATGGDGGLIETSGTQVNFTGAHIDTTAAAGKTGEWLVDPSDLTIDTSNNATLSADLATTSVVLQTTSTTPSSNPAGIGTITTTASTKGDINIDAPVSWSSTSTLTLEAYHSIYINAPVTISGAGGNAGKLVMTTNAVNTDGDLFFGGGGNVQFTGSGVGGVAGHLTINSVNYTLENSYAGLTSAANANPAGDYALATSVAAPSSTLTISPIGSGTLTNSSAIGTPFTGRIEGLGNVVSGLSLTDSSVPDQDAQSTTVFTGLIAYLGVGGVVRDIGVSNASVASTSFGSIVGALVGYNYGSIINAWSSGTVSGSIAGGLVGDNGPGGSISGSHSSATVNIFAESYINDAGGLVGSNSDTTAAGAALITTSYATGNVSDGGAESSEVGGLVGANGFLSSATISQSYATGVVTATGSGTFAGGLVGGNNDVIIDAYATGAVNAGSGVTAGGLAGANEQTIVNAYSTGKVTATAVGATIGASIGEDDSGTSNNPSAVTDVYYDNTINSIRGVGANNPFGPPQVAVHGQSTTALQDGVLPSGFNTAISAPNSAGSTSGTSSMTAWFAVSGAYPVLTFPYPHGPVAIQGTVFNGYDTSPVGTGLTVALSSYGSVAGSTQTNSSGAYTLVADSGQQSEVFLSGGAIHANTYLGTPTTATTANLYAGYLRLPSASNSLASTLAGVSLAVGNNTGSDFLYTSAGGLAANTSVDILTPSAFAVDTPLNAGTGTVSISAGGAVSQTAAITAANLALLGSGASYSLTNIDNSIGTLAANTSAVTLADNTALTVGAVNATTGVASTGAVSLSANGNLSLTSGGVTAGANSNVTLAATGDFLNSVGSAAVQVSGTGSWLIYSAAPGGDTFGALNSGDTAVWDTAAGGSVAAGGNRYVFAFQPTLTFTSTNDSKTYGNDATNQIQSDFAISGVQTGVANAYLGDTASSVHSGTPFLSSSGAAVSAQVSGGPYTITVAQGSVMASDGYVFASASTGQLTINPLAISASLTGPVVKTYDGTTDASLVSSDYTLNGIIPVDAANLSLSATSGGYAGKDVGTNLPVNFSGLALSGSAASDYTLSTAAFAGNVGQINPLAISASLTGPVVKTYDGTTDASLVSSDYILNGIVPADAANLVLNASSGAYAGKDVGTNSPVNFSGLALSGSAALDYSLSTAAFAGNVGQINALALTAGLVGNVTKTYDGTTDATLSGANYTLSASIGADVVSLVPVTSGTYDTKDAGTGKTVSVTGLTLTGAQAGDYSVATALSGAVGIINPLALTASLTGAISKVYDGTTAAASALAGGGYTLSTPISGDSVGLAATEASYDTKDVGTGKTVTFTGLSLTGADAFDYSLSTASLSGNVGVITPLALTASLTGPISRVYDGTTTANLIAGNYVLSGLVSGDSVGLNNPAFGTYDTKDVGTGKTVTVNGLALTGAQAGDYSVAGSVSGNVGIITPLALTASLTGTVNKTYDGTIAATLTAENYTLAGAVSGDSVTLNDPTAGTYDTKDAGTGKTVSVSGLALTGAQANDYSIASSVAGAVGTITPLALTASLIGTVAKTYEGTTAATLASSNYVLAGAVSGDSVALNDPTAGTYDTKDAGAGKTVTVGGLALTGADAEDYSVAGSVAGNVGTITPLALTASLTGTVSKTYDGTTAATLTAGNYTLAGAVSGDSVTLNDPTAGTYDTKDAGAGKTVTVSGLALTGADAEDYSVAGSVAGSVGSITAKVLAATVMANNKAYDATTTDTGSAALGAGLVAGDQVSLTAGTYTFTDPNAGQGKTVEVSGVALAGADARDYSLSVPADATADIAPRPITIAANDVGKLTGQADPPLTFSIPSGSLVGIDQVSGDLTRAPGEALGSYDISQGSLSLSANYALSFLGGMFTIAPPAPGPIIFAPANAAGSNAVNGPNAFTTSGLSLSAIPEPAPSAAGVGASPSPLAARLDDDNSDAPYPDNRRISDNIRFTVGTNP
jgi:filamentous hemagglutinin family protein